MLCGVEGEIQVLNPKRLPEKEGQCPAPMEQLVHFPPSTESLHSLAQKAENGCAVVLGAGLPNKAK